MTSTLLRPAPRPYVGATGLVTPEDADAFVRVASRLPAAAGRPRLMAGLLVSGRTLAGEAVPNRRYPAACELAALSARTAPVAFTTIHFNSPGEVPLSDAVLRALDCAPSAHGVQLNIRRPPVAEVERIAAERPDVEIILQVNGSSLGRPAQRTPAAADTYIREYAGLVSHALLDLSGGTGRIADGDWMAECLNTYGGGWLARGITPGIAGGFGPDAAAALPSVLARVSPGLRAQISVDAESRLRRPVADPIPDERYQDALDHAALEAYLFGGTWALLSANVPAIVPADSTRARVRSTRTQ